MLENRKLRLVDPATGEKKWYLPSSPEIFVFAFLLFPFITRKLWVWLGVWIAYDLIILLVTIGTWNAAPNEGIDKVFQLASLALVMWPTLMGNKVATRRLLAEGWKVSPETTEKAWQLFKKAWDLPDSARLAGRSPSGV